MNVSQGELLSELYLRLGNLYSNEEVTQPLVSLFLKEALEEYSKLRPKSQRFVVPIVAGQDVYPLDPSVIKVTEVILPEALTSQAFLPVDTGNFNLMGGTIVPANNSLPDFRDISIYQNPSIVTIEEMKRKEFSKFFSYSYEILQSSIRLTPVPSSDSNFVYVGSIAQTVTDTPDRDKVLLVNYVLGSCYYYVGVNRNTKFTQVPSPTGEIKMDNGKALMEEGKALKQDFYKKLSSGETAIQFAVG